MSPPEPPPEMDIFADTHHLFHRLQGRLTIIKTATDAVEDDHAAPLSAHQLAQLALIRAQTEELMTTLRVTAEALLDTLVLTPSQRLIWTCACRNGTRIRRATLARHVERLRTSYPLHPVTTAIAVAEADVLAPLRAALVAAGCAVRIASLPTDVRPMLEAAHAELVVMAPPADHEREWWRTVRLLLQTYAHQPLLMHIQSIEKAAHTTIDPTADQ
jgi:hypothetical protein